MDKVIDKAFSANYVNADHNFRIFNLQDSRYEGKYYSVLCLLLNLLQRGKPSDLSSYLKSRYSYGKSSEILHLISDEIPNWGTMIKGNNENSYYPAREFYYSIVPRYFGDYPFLQQILIPEVKIGDIIFGIGKKMVNQQVDFFLPQANLIIEIDGGQHKEIGQKILDQERNIYLEEAGYKTIRIPTECIRNNRKIYSYVEEIRERIKEYELIISRYQDSLKKCQNKEVDEELKLTASMRLQIALLQMCMSRMISLEDEKWSISIKNHELTGYEYAAVEDLFLWIENICCMANISFKRPLVVIEQTNLLHEVEKENIRIEMSLLERGTKHNTQNDWIYVYSDWRQDLDYFRMHTAKPIIYNIYYEQEERFSYDNENGYNEKRKALRFVLKNLYGFDEFRPGQERIIINALQGRDTIGVLPTGSGKSLCYQMAVLLQPCISFCVCPIKALMIDQDQNLKVRGIARTAFISSDLSSEEREKAQHEFEKGKYWLTFISPERFQTVSFRQHILKMSILQQHHFAYAVIDEVHCMSEWGHDFRVSYLNLTNTIKKYCEGIIMLGLTATASYNVLKNILIEFKMPDKRDVISIPSFTRPELNFIVEKLNDVNVPHKQTKDKIEKLIDRPKYRALKYLIETYKKFFPTLLKSEGDKSRCGIIFTPYVNGINGCHLLSVALGKDFEEKVEFYSGESPKEWIKEIDRLFDEYKRKVQNDFKDNYFTLLCATKAFGMGIDKPNIRYTVHYGLPSSLEALYQEAGRAGRDGEKATCTILYSPEDEEIREQINGLLALESTIEDMQYFIDGQKWNGEDIVRQLYLITNGLVPFDEEKEDIETLIEKYVKPGKQKVHIAVDSSVKNDLQNKQRLIYHLSLIGVVEDWTVNWRKNCVCVNFQDYTEESILDYTERYIQNYESDYQLKKDPNYLKQILEEESSVIITAFSVFWKWYNNNIIYSRKQSLMNVVEACDSYSKDEAEKFKEKIEAYFRLDDITDKLGIIADMPQEFKHWFDIINIDTIKKEKVRNMIMGLNRFLESYQNNVGLNYVSGFLNLIDNNFDSTNGRERMKQAINVIAGFDEKDRKAILEESAKVMFEVGDKQALESFSEFFIRNYPLEDADRHIYKIQNDSYSLHFYIKRILSKMLKDIEGTKYGKR